MRYLFTFSLATLIHLYLSQQVSAQQELGMIYRYLPERSTYTPLDSIRYAQLRKEARTIEQIKPDSALPYYQQVTDFALQKGYRAGVVKGLYGTAAVHRLMGRVDSALHYFNQALYHCRKPGQEFSDLLIRIYSSLGALYGVKANYPAAVAYMDQALRAGEKMEGMEDVNVTNMLNLGAIHLRLRQPQKALNYLQQAAHITRVRKEQPYLAGILNGQARAYEMLDSTEQAMACIREQLTIAQSTKDSAMLKLAYASMGSALLRQQQNAEALPYLQQAEQMLNGDPFEGYANLKINLGAAYFNLKDYPNAELKLKEAFKTSVENGINDELPHLHLILSQVYEAMGKPAQSLHHYKEHIALRDSLVKPEQLQSINELEVKYRILQKDKQLVQHRAALQANEHLLKEKNIIVIAISTGLLLLAILLVVLYRSRQKKIQLMQQEQAMNHLKDLVTGEEQERIRIARELHDGIGGMMAAINMNLSAVHKRQKDRHQLNDLEPIMQMVDAATDEVRKTAHNLMPDIMTRYELGKAVQLYCDQMSAGGAIKIALSILGQPSPLPKAVELVIYRMVQELVQNIVKHAEASEAMVELEQYPDRINIIVEDNGKGFDPHRMNGGYGLQNLQHRIQSLQGDIYIESAPGMGTTINIAFDTQKLTQILGHEHHPSHSR